MTLTLILWGAGGLLALSLLAVCVRGEHSVSRIVYGTSFAISAALLIAAATHIGAAPSDLVLPIGLPWLGAHFHIDALAAFFLAVVNLGGAIASFFALGYGQHEIEPVRVLPFFTAFLAGMNLVVIAGDAFTFLFAWEFMSLSSWALVVSHHREPDNIRAGYIYLLMAGFSAFCLLLAFGLLGGAGGGYSFAAMRLPHTPVLAAFVLLLALLGAGSKAGLVPLHVWLPLAHPSAPSHVSALMSGVMTKVAIYAFIRIVFDLLGPPAWWWGVAVLAIASITAVLGVLQALMEHDLKRLLAYHTVENIGIIFIGLGLALAFRANGMVFAAALALTAALLHVLNHSVFKSLLFFGSGAVLAATGERDMERLGGLIHRMPQTAFAFLVGAAAISALPPLNGFVSEWLTFQAIFLSPSLPQWGLRLLVPTVGAALAFSAALAATCFVKAFGVTFLGRARTAEAAQAIETDRFSRSAMFALASLCLLLGILPGLAIDWISPAAAELVHGHMPVQRFLPWLTIIPIAQSRSSYNGLLVFVFIAASTVLAIWAIHTFASRAARRAPAWDCGTPSSSPLTQYSAGSFAQPIRRVFGTVVFRAREHVTMPPPGDARPAVLAVELHDVPWEALYMPIASSVSYLAERLNVLQFLTIRRYLTLVFFALILLLLGNGDMVLMRDLVVQAAQMVLVLALSPLLMGFVRKCRAYLQRRRGASIFQPYRDLARLLRKDVVLAENASWLFRAAPYLIFAATWVAAALIPTFAAGLLFSWSADLIAIVALLGSARFFLALAALDVGTSFGGIGSTREMMIASLAEPAMIMMAFTVALVAGSTQLSTIAATLTFTHVGLRVSLALALVALILVAIAENGRIPIDNPSTHLELTMVHEAMVLEYSGRHLAMIELASQLKLLVYFSLIGCVFAPISLAAAESGPVSYLIGAGAFAAKLAFGGALLAIFETATAKMRVFRVPNYLGAALMLGFLGTLLLFVSRTL